MEVYEDEGPMRDEDGLELNEGKIGDYDEPTVFTDTTGIQAPPSSTTCRIRSGLIEMVQERKYMGLDLENPIDHLNHFEKLMRITKMGGASEDTINLTYFPFSLGGEAAQWENNVETSTILTWEDCKQSFMTRFFTRQRTERIKQELRLFKQSNTEELHEAWERFGKYTKLCPFHGFKEDALLTIFHNGLIPRYHEMLNVASGGSFADLGMTKGRKLIEKLSQSGRSYQGSYLKELGGNNDKEEMRSLREQMVSMNEKMETMMFFQQRMPQPTNTRYKERDEVSSMDYEGWLANKYPMRTPSPKKERNEEDEAKEREYEKQLGPSREERFESMLNRIIDGQSEMASSTSKKMEGLNSRIDDMYGTLSAKINEMDAKINGSSTNGMESSQDSDNEASAMELRSGKALPPR